MGWGGYITRYDKKEITDIPVNFARDYFSGKNEEKEKLENEREELLKKLKETEENLLKYK